MPRGYPDYFGQSIFPKYGGFKEYYHTEANLDAAAYTTVVNIAAKGRLYGGYVYLYGAPMDAFCKIRVSVDGTTVNEVSINYLRDYYCSNNPYKILNMITYNDEDKIYVVEVGNGLTFESSYKVEVWGTADGALDSVSRIQYAEVT